MHAALSRVSEVRSERLIEELLRAQGWDLRKPPQGAVYTQQKYKDNPVLREALAECSKTG
jgi:aspartate/methionine/tyrosine aminotransferase